MPDVYGTRFIRLDTGLLDDTRLGRMPLEAQALWMRLYLVLGRIGGFATDRAHLDWLAQREAGADAPRLLRIIDEAGWFEQNTRGVTIRGFTRYQKPMTIDPTATERQRRSRARRKLGFIAPAASHDPDDGLGI